MKKLTCLILILASATSVGGFAQVEPGTVNFAVMALDIEDESRQLLEDALALRLQQNQYSASPSYPVIGDITEIDSSNIRVRLANAGMDAVLIIRPLDIGEKATIESVQQYLAPRNYRTIAEFVDGYRGHDFDTQAVIHIVGYLFDENRSLPIWQGVMWFDDQVDSEEEGIDKIVDMVEFNLNHYRPAIRQQLGLPPLPASE